MTISDGRSHDHPTLSFSSGSRLTTLPVDLSRVTSFVVFLCTLILVSGCVPSASGPQFQQLDKSQKGICQVAVLPFVNTTDYVQGGTLFYRIFIAELNRHGGFKIAHEGDIRRILRQMKVNPKEIPNYEQSQVLADRLGVDAIITGEIVAMDDEKGVLETDPLLAVNLKIQEAGSNKPLITTYHSRRGGEYRKVMHFGLVNTMTSLAVRVSDEILEIWFTEGLKPCAQ